MNITVNGQAMRVGQVDTVSSLLEHLGYPDRFLAVAVNQDCILRSEFSCRKIQEGDEVEILAPMAGG